MEQEDQQEAAASLTVAGKEKKESFMTGTHYQSICLVNSAFSAGQRMLIVLHKKKVHFFKNHQAM